jgi:hypothetical protein
MTELDIESHAHDGTDAACAADNDGTNPLPVSGADKKSERAWGCAKLTLVALLEGTYSVTLRAIYDTEGPPAACMLLLLRQILKLVACVPFLAAEALTRPTEGGAGPRWGEGAETEALVGSACGLGVEEAFVDCEGDSVKGEENIAFAESDSRFNTHTLARSEEDKTKKVLPMWMRALELAIWNGGCTVR